MASISAEFIQITEPYHALSSGSVFGYLLRKQNCKHFYSYILSYEANPKGTAFQWIWWAVKVMSLLKCYTAVPWTWWSISTLHIYPLMAESQLTLSNIKETPWLLVRKRTIPTERPPLVGEVSANFCGWRVSRGHCNRSPRPLICFLDQSRYFSNQVAPQLSSQGWVDPVSDPLLLRKSGSAKNRTWDLWICSQELWPLDHRGGLLSNINI
jgi:hypothetical protein